MSTVVLPEARGASTGATAWDVAAVPVAEGTEGRVMTAGRKEPSVAVPTRIRSASQRVPETRRDEPVRFRLLAPPEAGLAAELAATFDVAAEADERCTPPVEPNPRTTRGPWRSRGARAGVGATSSTVVSSASSGSTTDIIGE